MNPDCISSKSARRKFYYGRLGGLFVLVLAALMGLASEAECQTEASRPWIATVRIIRNGEQSGSGVYLRAGLIVTAAHLTAGDATMSVHIGGVRLPAQIVKQGEYEDVDLTLLSVEQDALPKKSRAA